MVATRLLAVRRLFLSCIKPMVVRHITQGCVEATTLARHYRNFIYQTCTTTELCCRGLKLNKRNVHKGECGITDIQFSLLIQNINYTVPLSTVYHHLLGTYA